MNKTYRSGAIGAMMDEYERATGELIPIIESLDEQTYVAVLDLQTKDSDCSSIKTIMNHVVRAGYTYANYIRREFGEEMTDRIEDHQLESVASVALAVDKMMTFTIAALEGKWELSEEELAKRKFTSGWGQEYDIEQILEHAIVHILRHRRQIERLLASS